MSSGRRPVSMAISIAVLDLRRLQGVQVGAQLGHDLRREVASRLAAHGFGGDVADPDGEVAVQPGGGLPGAGQAQGADPGQHERGRRGRRRCGGSG